TTPFAHALSLIDAAHADDPTLTTLADGTTLPYELHYARQMTRYLALHTGAVLAYDCHASTRATETATAPPSEALQLAVRAQHLRRWEVPRSSYPPTRAGYLSWRTGQGKRAGALASSYCATAGLAPAICARVQALVGKEGLRTGDAEAQILEDVACLVFLDDQFAGFVAGGGGAVEVDEEKAVRIVRKTWAKMGGRGRELAGGIAGVLEGKAGEVLARAL
ncbi:uncharacterized protein K452DRAFT_193430, partial [Aplosporella prunicola CBS 121167]